MSAAYFRIREHNNSEWTRRVRLSEGNVDFECTKATTATRGVLAECRERNSNEWCLEAVMRVDDKTDQEVKSLLQQADIVYDVEVTEAKQAVTYSNIKVATQ